MDLPTYTNIWRIEKRLYKLYDLRLPMPLPIVWIGVFVGVLAPWSLLLYLVGLPFDAPWHVVYLVPPGIVTWLSTRPVIESKRLTELLQSQVRYVGEPRTWCRMAPTSEPSEITLTGRIWQASPQQAASIRVKVSRRARHTQSKRAAIASSREVRPAVAAAAAAVATAPVTRERVAWDTTATLAPRRGTAPALGHAVSTETSPVVPVVPVAPVSAVSTPSAPVSVSSMPSASPSAVSTPSSSTSSPASSSGPSGVVPAAPIEGVRDLSPSIPAAPLKALADPVAAVAAEPVSPRVEASPASPASTASDDPAVAPVAPIGTEALRRLRRLAALADAERGVSATPDQMSAPAAAVTPVRIPDRLVAERPSVVPDPVERPSAPAVPSIVPRFAEPAPIGRRATEPGEAAEADESAWAQHRKGQPAPRGKFAETSKAWPPERSAGMPGNMSIRAVPPASAAQADPVVSAVPVPRPAQGENRVRRVESVVGRDSSGGWRRLAQVVIGPGGGGRTDGSEIDEARARAVFSGSRRVVVLGCTGGAGQTTTALMLGHTLARYREDRVLAVDANTGTHALSSRVQGESPETLSSLLTGLDNIHGYLGMRAYTSRCASGLEVLAGDTDAGAEQRLSDRTLFSDRRLGQTMDMLDRHYKLTVMDPAAALAARVLSYADQLVLVVPASEDGPDAVAMTYEWLDGHGCADLRQRAIMVVNGVSRRSMGDVEQAEAVARGSCRAIVRVPWEDELAPGRSNRTEPSHLRAPGRRAYLALAGVVVAGFGAVQAIRSSEEELAQ